MNKTYLQRKEEARQKAIEWQLDFSNHNYSYLDLAQFKSEFCHLGKRYGLLKEFKENGII